MKVIFKAKKKPNVSQDVEKLKPSYIAGEDIK